MGSNPEGTPKRGEHNQSEANTEFQRLTITDLINDNDSEIAHERLGTWQETRAAGQLIKVRTCGDSRLILPDPDKEVVIRSIAAGKSSREPGALILEDPGVKGAVIMAHFDGDTIKPDQMPIGCGGLAVKESQAKKGKGSKKIDKFIASNVYDPDPILQAVKSAQHLAGRTNKPVLAVAQNHRDGKVYPLAAFYTWHDSLVKIMRKQVSRSFVEYNAEELYEQGIPSILQDDAPPDLHEFMIQSRDRMISLKESFPNLHEESKIQDPPLIVLSTSIIPFSTRFPQIGNRPGTAFEVFVARTRFDDTSLRLGDFEKSLDQMEYPIDKSLANHGKKGKSFANTNTILIDTESMPLSIELAEKFVSGHGDSIRAWLDLPNHNIFISQTIEGKTTAIKEYRLT